MSDRYRTGGHWGVTIVRQGLDVAGEADELVAVVTNGDRELADRICWLLNGVERKRRMVEHGQELLPDSCTCRAEPDPACPVHQGRKARGPKPPPLGPGCICDGSGRTCPRHGVVL
jgi:hypothetical protein